MNKQNFQQLPISFPHGAFSFRRSARAPALWPSPSCLRPAGWRLAAGVVKKDDASLTGLSGSSALSGLTDLSGLCGLNGSIG